MRNPVDTSSAAEMMACVNGLARGYALGLVQPGDHVLVQTDCERAIRVFEGTLAANTKDERESVRQFRAFRREHSLGVSFRHVKGHTGRTEARYVTNHLCDKRAKNGMRSARAATKRGPFCEA